MNVKQTTTHEEYTRPLLKLTSLHGKTLAHMGNRGQSNDILHANANRKKETDQDGGEHTTTNNTHYTTHTSTAEERSYRRQVVRTQ